MAVAAPAPEWTAEEERWVSELRARLADLLGDAGAPDAVSDAEEDTQAAHARALSDDGTLLRFGIARKLVLDDAEAMFRATVAWREKIGLCKMWRDWHGGGVGGSGGRCDDLDEAGGPTEESRLSQRFYYGGRFGDARPVAHTGDSTLPAAPPAPPGPVLVDRLGRVDLRGIVREEIVELVKKSYIVNLEDAFREVRRRGGPRSKVRAVIVVDVDGVGLAHLQHMRVIMAWEVGSAYFPEITRRVFLVRSGWMLPLVWKAIAPLLPANTRAKVRIAGSLEELRADVPADALPAEVSYEPGASMTYAAWHKCPAELVPVGTREVAAAFESSEER